MKRKYVLGTAVKVTSIVSTTPDAMYITVKDPNGTTKLDEGAMSRDSDRVYSYIYQSSDIDTQGIYNIIIKAVNGSYTSVTTTQIEMEDQP